MTTTTRRSATLAAVLMTVATTGVVVGTAESASAGNCRGSLCGGLTNSANSPRAKPLQYTRGWRTSGGQVSDGSLAPGRTTGGYGSGVDIDGYYIPSGCVGYGGTANGQTSGWYKIADFTHPTITLYC